MSPGTNLLVSEIHEPRLVVPLERKRQTAAQTSSTRDVARIDEASISRSADSTCDNSSTVTSSAASTFESCQAGCQAVDKSSAIAGCPATTTKLIESFGRTMLASLRIGFDRAWGRASELESFAEASFAAGIASRKNSQKSFVCSAVSGLAVSPSLIACHESP